MLLSNMKGFWSRRWSSSVHRSYCLPSIYCIQTLCLGIYTSSFIFTLTNSEILLSDANRKTLMTGEVLESLWASLAAQLVKESACSAGDPGSIPGLESYPWRTAWQPTPVFLPGESPWTEERGGLQSMWSQRVRHDWATKHTHRLYTYRKDTQVEIEKKNHPYSVAQR